jgi:sulfotransferase
VIFLNHIVYDEAEYDELLGMPGLHLVKPQVAVVKRNLCLPPDLSAQLEPLDFWRKGHNPRDVLLL